jgi:uncharacterized membrane protein
MLVYYIGHITNAIRIDSIMHRVEADTRRTLIRFHNPVDWTAGDPDLVSVPALPDHAIILPASADGYVQGVDARLLPLAARKGLTVRLLPLVGYHVVAGYDLAVVWSDDGSPLKQTTLGAVTALISVNPERRIEREFGLGLRQLVDIINRAMSTGQNDPYTAAQALHHLTSLMADASHRTFATYQFRDRSGKVRVVVPIMSFPTHLGVVCGHTRQGGLERHPRVTLELLRMLGVLGVTTVGERRVQAIRREVEVVMADAARMIPTQTDLDEVLELGKHVLSSLDARDAERCT